MLKLMVPIAHASNLAGNHQNKSFFATLCTANTIIQVPLDLPIDNDAPSQVNQSQEKCPLCVVADLSEFNVDTAAAFKPFLGVPEQFPEYNARSFITQASLLAVIRAPPKFSKLR